MKYKATKVIFAALLSGCGLMGASAYAIDNQTAGQTTGNQMQMQTSTNDGAAFLATNKTKPGVVSLPDGLQYKVIKNGSGDPGNPDATPGANDVVKVNYTGKFVDGKVFDSSKGTPVSFPVGGVIPGFSEALMKMKKGSVWEVYIPANLAYGAAGAPPVIGPNQTLIFTIELVDYNKNS